MGRAKSILEVRNVVGKDAFLEQVKSLDQIVPTSIYYSGRSGEVIEDKARIGIRNGRTGELVGVASNNWLPVSHAEAFNTVIDQASELVGSNFYGKVTNNANYASIDILYGELADVDALAFGIHAVNTYKIGTTVKISSLFVRAACTNGMLVSDVSSSVDMNHLRYLPDYREKLVRLAQPAISERAFNYLLDNPIQDVRLGNDVSRYHLYNLYTAYATHCGVSGNKFE